MDEPRQHGSRALAITVPEPGIGAGAGRVLPFAPFLAQLVASAFGLETQRCKRRHDPGLAALLYEMRAIEPRMAPTGLDRSS